MMIREARMAKDVSLQGHYTIVYSPDDEAESGKGYYVDRWWTRRESKLFATWAEADAWAVLHGGVDRHKQQV